MEKVLALTPIILPLIGVLLVLFVDRYSERGRGAVSVVYTAILFAGSAAYTASLQGDVSPLSFGPIVLDAPGMVIVSLVFFIGALVLLYSQSYKRDEFDAVYFVAYFLFMSTMNGLATSYNIVVMFVFLEAATVISAFLVLYSRTTRAVRAATIYLAISIFEVILIIVAVFVLYSQTGTVDLLAMQPDRISDSYRVPLTLLLLFGFGTKAGLLPLSFFWLPPAHAEAPSSISATMSGIMIKAGVLATAKAIFTLYPVLDVHTIALVVGGFGAANMLVGVVAAALSYDIKRLLAFHSISQMGYIFLGIGIATSLSTYGALFHVLNHMLFKGCLFLITGILLLQVGTRRIDEMGGLLKRMPVTAVCFLIASLAMSGVPGLNGAVSKGIIHEATIEAGFPFFATIADITSVLTFYSLVIHAFYRMFLRKQKDELTDATDPPPSMMIPVLILAGLCVVLGLFPGLISSTLEFAGQTLSQIAIG